MAEQHVPVKRTVITLRDYAAAVIRAWKGVDNGPCAKSAVAVLWGQYMIETGGAACWNFNVGNCKKVIGDGHDFHELRGVWEGVSPAEAERLIASGSAARDNSADHAKAVGKGRVSVLFQPPHPATRFRAFPDLTSAMQDHLKLLARRFAVAWPAVVLGDIHMFAILLRSKGYFTASAEAYEAGMRRPFNDAMVSTAYDDAMADYLDALDAPTISEFPVAVDETPLPLLNTPIMGTVYPRPLPESVTGSGGIIHPLMYPLDVDPDDAA